MTHRRIREQLYDYVDGQLSDREATLVRIHLDHCKACAAEFAGLQQFRALTLESSPKPADARSEEYWGSVADSVQQHITSDTDRRNERLRDSIEFLTSFIHLHRRIAFSGAGALAVAGLVAFFLIAPRPTPSVEEPHARQSDPIHEIESTDDLHHYLRKSKALLVGLSNLKTPEAVATDFAAERRLSSQLAEEARQLRGRVIDRRTSQLLGNLEKVFVEISSLESETAVRQIEAVRGDIREGNLLFKIRMAETVPDSFRFVLGGRGR